MLLTGGPLQYWVCEPRTQTREHRVPAAVERGDAVSRFATAHALQTFDMLAYCHRTL